MTNRTVMHKETWRDIFPYDGVYQVSNLGRVRNAKYDRILAQHVDKNGYHIVYLTDNEKKVKNWRVHRLVALCFVPIFSLERNQVNHIDGNKWNNEAVNLEWCNNSENQKHHHRVIKTGYLFGMKNHKAKITEQQMKEIRAKYATHKYTQTQLADEYNITQSAVSQIISNKIRKYN